ncbi:MAG: hypothetical protein JRN57_04455 [Nitrososphaerota archaeon]|nr:hypothetical protein [Nitrososphaerota archaeon]
MVHVEKVSDSTLAAVHKTPGGRPASADAKTKTRHAEAEELAPDITQASSSRQAGACPSREW